MKESIKSIPAVRARATQVEGKSVHKYWALVDLSNVD